MKEDPKHIAEIKSACRAAHTRYKSDGEYLRVQLQEYVRLRIPYSTDFNWDPPRLEQGDRRNHGTQRYPKYRTTWRAYSSAKFKPRIVVDDYWYDNLLVDTFPLPSRWEQQYLEKWFKGFGDYVRSYAETIVLVRHVSLLTDAIIIANNHKETALVLSLRELVQKLKEETQEQNEIKEAIIKNLSE